MDLVIRGGTVVTAEKAFRADVGVEGGRIAAIGEGLEAPERIDAAGCYVLPGAIDPHVHLRLPSAGNLSADDFDTGTVAAACGGTTTLIDFVTPLPGQGLLDALASRRAEADGHVAVDYGLHMTLIDASPDTLSQVPSLVEAGVPSFKMYMTYPGLCVDDEALLAAMDAIARSRGLALVHAENDAIVGYCTRRLLAEGRTGVDAFPRSRPSIAEGEAAGRALALAQTAGAPLYIVHMTCREALTALREARRRGQTAFAETCAQYLLLTEREYMRPGFEGAKCVVAPPLRTQADADTLWSALGDGQLQVVSTDHCCFNYRGQKDLGLESFARIPPGAPGVETRLALLHTFGVLAGRLSLNRWVDVCATTPARLFGLPDKGAIRVGADADLVVFDPRKVVTVRQADLHQHVDYTPYEGLSLTGYPVATLVRGQTVMRDGAFCGSRGGGRFLVRRPWTGPAGGADAAR